MPSSRRIGSTSQFFVGLTDVETGNSVLFICDMQEKFADVVHRFSSIVSTAEKLLEVSRILSIPVFSTTQNKARLGDTVQSLQVQHVSGCWDKTAFSMLIPELREAIADAPRVVAIVGIEAHICVTQTALDLIEAGHTVYIIADGVSSCNPEEVGVSLARLRAAGATITTSESWIFEVMGDASIGEFRQISGLIKSTKDATKDALQCLL